MFLTEWCTLLKICENTSVVSILINVEERLEPAPPRPKHRNPVKQEVQKCTEKTGMRPDLLSANGFPALAQCAKPLGAP